MRKPAQLQRRPISQGRPPVDSFSSPQRLEKTARLEPLRSPLANLVCHYFTPTTPGPSIPFCAGYRKPFGWPFLRWLALSMPRLCKCSRGAEESRLNRRLYDSYFFGLSPQSAPGGGLHCRLFVNNSLSANGMQSRAYLPPLTLAKGTREKVIGICGSLTWGMSRQCVVVTAETRSLSVWEGEEDA